MNIQNGNNEFVMIESAGFVRAGNVYKIYNQNGENIHIIVEEVPSFFKKILKYTPLKTLLGFNIKLYDNQNNVILRLQRSFTFFLSNIDLYNSEDEFFVRFKQKFKFIIAKFDILDKDKKKIAILKGDWIDWRFKFYRPDKTEIGKINKKWAGFLKELFTTADKYLIKISDMKNESDKILLFSSAVIIDMVLKEYT